MTKIVALLKRRQGMSKQEFRKYYEEKHILLCYKGTLGLAVDYRRNYIEDSFGAGAGDKYVDPLALDYDVVTEVWFKTREDAERVLKGMDMSAELSELIVKDESNLFDRSAHRFMICDEVVTEPSLLR